MGNLASQQLSSQSDPDVVRRQILADREKQLAGISNPQQQLAARLGGLLGGGLTNLYQDKGFFEVNDPLLTKVSKIQNIYNEVAGRIDPTADPVKFYSALQSAYSQANLGREALAASQEGAKAKLSGLDLQDKEFRLLERSPELVAQKIEEARATGNDIELARLTGLQTRYNENRQLDLDAKRTAILKDKAYISYQTQLAEQGKFRVQVANPDRPDLGFIRINERTGAVEAVPLPQELADKYSVTSSTDPKKEVTAKAADFAGTTAKTPAAPKPRGKMEQNALDKIEERKRTQAEEQAARAGKLEEGRRSINAIAERAASLGYIPLGIENFEQTFLDPQTNRKVRASDLQ